MEADGVPTFPGELMPEDVKHGRREKVMTQYGAIPTEIK